MRSADSSLPLSRRSSLLAGVLGGDAINSGGDRGGGVDMTGDGGLLGVGELDLLIAGDQPPGGKVRGDCVAEGGDQRGPGRGLVLRGGVETGVPLLPVPWGDHCPGDHAVDGATYPGLYGLYNTGRGRDTRHSSFILSV